MDEQKRVFKGVWIPKEVWLDKRLNMLEKGILTEIDSLDNEDNGCFASNKYLSEFCQCSETKVSTAISKLINLQYIYVKSFDGRIRILKSRLSKNERQDLKNLNSDFKNFKDNNINNNNKYNIYIKEIIDYLNSKADKNYKTNTSNTTKNITARLNEGYTVDDFFKVINRKVDDWKGTIYEKYLRPETLFGSKFEGYLNEKWVTSKPTTAFRQREYTDEQLNSLFDNLENVDI